MESVEQGKRTDLVWNFLTLLALSGVVLVFIFVAAVFNNPSAAINPFPPPVLPTADTALVVAPSPEPTLAPTQEPTAAPTNTTAPTQEILPTLTAPAPLVTVTVIQEGEGEAPEPTEVVASYAYGVKNEVVPLPGKIFHADWECEWLGVAGQVEDLQGRPAKGIRVAVGGFIDGSTMKLDSLTGTALQYGPAGYEFKLADAPFDSNDNLWIQLLDQSGYPLSKKTKFSTFANCEKNLLLINFKQMR
jgi:hypothetical protein